MTRLRDHLSALIANEGPLSVAEFMRTVLAHYYGRGEAFGAEGDFITAPEISQVFGELIGAWCVAVWEQLGSPSRFSLVELGPGRGTLMRDALRAARVRPAFLEAADVVLVEISPSLREHQLETLQHVQVGSLKWVEQFEAPEGQPLIVIANEFFDALPIHQLVATKDGWRERCIRLEGGGFVFALSPVPMPRQLIPAAHRDAAEGAVIEIAPARNTLATMIGERLAKDRGAALVIDYGFSGPAVGDTLQAVRAHKFESVLSDPGHADLTSHVDFTALTTGFVNGGALVYGPMGQGVLLERLGARERIAALMVRATPEQRRMLDSGFTRLTAQDQMGSLFKALAAASPGLHPPGFVPS